METRNLSPTEIRSQIAELNAELQRRQQEEKRQFFVEISQRAQELGITREELVRRFKGGTTTKKARPKRPSGTPMYRNPNNSQQTWTGRGRKPGWLVELLERGVSLDSLKI